MSGPAPGAGPAWYAVHTRPGGEYAAFRALDAAGLFDQVLLPLSGGRAPACLVAPTTRRDDVLLFPGYLLVYGVADPGTIEAVGRSEAVRYLVGAKPNEPSPIPEPQVRLVRYLMTLDRHPRLGAVPDKGRRARIVSGPMAGIEGVVVWRNKEQARLAAPVQVLGQAVEIVAPLDVLVLADYETWGRQYRRPHRGGRRGRPARGGEHDPAGEASA